MLTGENVKPGTLLNSSLGFDTIKNGHTYEKFKMPPLTANILAGGAALGATGDINLLQFQHNTFQEHLKGAGQTIITPVVSAYGLDISHDLVSTEGSELNQGIHSNAKHAYTIGTDGPFFVRAKIKPADASGCNPLVVGFRLAEAHQAAIANYDTYAYLGIVGTSNPNLIKAVSELAGAGAVTTDTLLTWADAAVKDLRVEVSAKGVVTYSVNGLPCTIPNALKLTLTSGIVVVPFLFFLHAATSPGLIHLVEWECGLVPQNRAKRIKA